jgi:tRNA (guanine37-N1)-methyltransferase
MHFEIITIFPEFFAGPLDYGIVRRAREARIANVRVHDLRAFAHDRHRTVDDRPFGGGEGMVLKPEPLFEAVESVLGQGVCSDVGAYDDSHPWVGAQHAALLHGEGAPIVPLGTAIVLLSASGKLFRQETARRFAQLDRIILLCGRYEGVDERVTEHLVTDELSIGDYVLSGGELAAALILDAVTRLLPGALGNEDSTINESFSAIEAAGAGAEFPTTHQSLVTGHSSPFAAQNGRHLLLDFPHYTRPAEFRSWPVPEVLLGGNHEEIRKWRREKALEKTRRNRPDLLAINI